MSDTTGTHPLLEQLVTRHGATALGTDAIDAFCAHGTCLIVLAEDPARYRETLDLAVIAPELLRAFPSRFRLGVLFPEAARVAAPRFGIRRWPALVITRDGRRTGSIEGLRNWDEYLATLHAMLADSSPVPATSAAGVAPSPWRITQ